MSRWTLLAERENVRRFYTATKLPRSPEEVFYSVWKSREHRKLNRYADVLAYDRTAVSVDGEYLNANVVEDGYGGWWVAAQAPLPDTIPAFVTAIKTHAASRHPFIRATTRGAIIVQLTGYEERGIRKADPYLDHFEHVSTTEMPKLGSTLTEMRADEVDVSHYHFKAWPDHGVPLPADRPALKALVLEVGRRQKEGQKEVWVHCSAGVGRSGAFITLSSLFLRTGPYETRERSPLGPLKLPSSDVVAHTIDGLREYRGMLVQMEQQMELVDDMYRRHTS